MKRTMIGTLAGALLLGGFLGPMIGASASSHKAAVTGYEPVLVPANFVAVIDNPYFPLPVGRTLIYKGIKDGVTQTDRVTVTSHTKVLEGIIATTISDIATHHGRLLEKTRDWYAQDAQGNVWYLGEDTKAYLPNGTVDTAGSWKAGVNDGEPGIIMPANPRIPNGYRQEYLKGVAADTAWTVQRGGSVTVPYGRVTHILVSLEASAVEPGAYDQKVYAPGVGVVIERAITKGLEVARLVKVIDLA
jgi:hypothetical protein